MVLGMGGGGRVVEGVAEGCRRSGSRILWAVQAATAYSPLHQDLGLLKLPVKLHTGPLTLLSGPVKDGTDVSGVPVDVASGVGPGTSHMALHVSVRPSTLWVEGGSGPWEVVVRLAEHTETIGRLLPCNHAGQRRVAADCPTSPSHNHQTHHMDQPVYCCWGMGGGLGVK